MSRLIMLPATLFWVALLACDGTSDKDATVEPPQQLTREEAICRDICDKGGACGFMDGCLSVGECRYYCVAQHTLTQLSDQCLSGLEAFTSCYWSSLSCEEILARVDDKTICQSEFNAIEDPCEGDAGGFDVDLYVYLPLMCIYGTG